MYSASVKNLYIGKSGIDIQVQGEINGIRIKGAASLDPTTLVGEIFEPVPIIRTKNPDYGLIPKYPDYCLINGYWDNQKFLINPIGTDLYTLWITGIPLGTSINEYLLKGNVYHKTFTDSHRTYLFQITKQQLV